MTARDWVQTAIAIALFMIAAVLLGYGFGLWP